MEDTLSSRGAGTGEAPGPAARLMAEAASLSAQLGGAIVVPFNIDREPDENGKHRKRPANIKTWRDVTRPLTEPSDERRWRPPANGIGVRCDNLFVVDYDDIDLLEAHQAAGLIPDTYTVRTVSGGLHAYFRPDPDVVLPKHNKSKAPVDLKAGSGHLVVGAGSYGYTATGGGILPVAEAVSLLADLAHRWPPAQTHFSAADTDLTDHYLWTVAEIRELLGYLDPNAQSYDWCADRSIAIAHTIDTEEARLLVNEWWQRRDSTHTYRDMPPAKWETMKAPPTAGKPITMGTLVADAKALGYRPPWAQQQQARKQARAAARKAGALKELPYTAEGLAEGLADMGIDIRFNTRARRNEHRQTLAPGSFRTPGGATKLWLSAPLPTGLWEPINDRLVERVRDLLAQQYERTTYDGSYREWTAPTEQFYRWLDALAGADEVDPFLAWLEDLPDWDGTPRVSGLLVSLLGGDPACPLTEWASRAPFVGSIRRAYVPGSKIDEFPVLIAAQGVAKTAFVEGLLPPEYREDWFSDSLTLSSSPKEQDEALAGRVIVEIAEMSGRTRAERDRLKAFLTSRADGKARAAYARSADPYRRKCVFVGTANDTGSGVLPADPSGHRRYVCIRLLGATQAVEPVLDSLREQIWAEALHRYHLAEDGWDDGRLPRSLAAAQADANEPHAIADTPLQERVANFAVQATNGKTLQDLGLAAGLTEGEPLTPRDQYRLSEALAAQGWEKRRESHSGKRLYLWFPPPF